jgi:hypothetical protein
MKNYAVVRQTSSKPEKYTILSWHNTSNEAIEARDIADVRTLRFTSIVLTSGQVEKARKDGLI